LDKNGYFLILPQREQGEILVEHYHNDGMLQHRIVGHNAADLCNTIISRELATQLDHAAYLGHWSFLTFAALMKSLTSTLLGFVLRRTVIQTHWQNG
jgi:hypothetical protein